MTRDVRLRDVTEADLPVFFAHQLDEAANRMAAFTAKDPRDEAAFAAHWARILNDESVTVRTILDDGAVAGHVASFERLGRREVTYWVGKEHWGKGVATSALSAFVERFGARPLYARVAKDNVASLRVLERCGFAICGEDRGFAPARGEEVDEFILQLGDAR